MKRNTFLKNIGLLSIGTYMGNIADLSKLTDGFSKADKMPVLFLGHGSPMNAIEENLWVDEFRALGKKLPQPNAILCISAHWYTKGTWVTAMEQPKTIHDFGGFPQALFDVQYPAPGDPKLAQETADLLEPVQVGLDETWGLDHGTWSVLKHLYPNANVPIIQLSIDYTKPPQFHYELAQKLKSLRNKGVLIVGSGNIIHNLRMVDFRNINNPGYGYDWAHEVQKTSNQWILDHNIDPLMNYQNQGKAFQLAVPTPDHYLPLMYAMGLRDNKDTPFLFNDDLVAGSLSMTSVLYS